MQHSLFRQRREVVKLFSHKDPSKVQKTLKVFSYTSRGFEEISQPNPNIVDLNVGYYSTEIITPDEHCYLMILFCGNPIVLRVGEPTLQFIYWSKRNSDINFRHYNEDGILQKEGILSRLSHGFYFYTPVDVKLGYIEVNGKPHILSIPYSVGIAGIGIDVDWQRTIIRQNFGSSVTKLNFTLNKQTNTFKVKTKEFKFNLRFRKQKHSVVTKKLHFKVFCRS